MRPVFIASLAGKIAALAAFSTSPWLAVGFFFGPDFVILYHIFAPGGQGLGRVFTRFETPRDEVWLTIDDGPDPDDTPRILDLLDRHGAKATFFLIGERAARHPELVAAIVRRGHEVGHHTETHPMLLLWCSPRSRVIREIDRGLRSLARSSVSPRWFRPPVGIKSIFLHAALKERGLVCVNWSVRSGDVAARNLSRVISRVLRRVRRGDIILMHEGPPVHASVRVTALAGVLAGLQARGFSCILPEPHSLRRP